MLKKCCCCFSLKYGFFTYSVIALALRMCLILLIYLSPSSIITKSWFKLNNEDFAVIAKHAALVWMIFTIYSIFLTMQGIVQRKSILMYPYIVTLILETILGFIWFIVLVVKISAMYLINIAIMSGLNSHAALCLICLYKQTKEKEKIIYI